MSEFKIQKAEGSYKLEDMQKRASVASTADGLTLEGPNFKLGCLTACPDMLLFACEELAKANERVIDSIIEPLFKARWSGALSDAPVSEMRDQLFKTLRDQTMGYWSGHTAYNIAVDGGFLVNDKKGANKRLTSLGAMFVEQEQPRTEQEKC